MSWSWVGFCIGCFGAFIMEFTRFIRQAKIPTQTFTIANTYVKTEKINYSGFITSIVYIAIGGTIAAIFATTITDSFLYGGLWEALFTYVITLKNGA
jgi:hypothetical protein